jgi:ABC-2 type transport system ATP-binding protein
MSIKVEHITKLYGEQKALDDVSFEIKTGEIVGFLGPNGAGKSTMMKIICGYIPQTTGKVTVCGFDIIENPLEVKKHIGYLPEHNPLYLDMYIKEYLHFVGGIFHLENLKDRVEEMVEMVGLTKEQHKKIGQLSKGYRQRVGLAQALIHNPEVLILDEPTTGLDPNQLEEIRNLIKEIGKQKTIMLSTHIMQEVEAICDRTIIINQGKIVADNSTKNLQSTVKNKIVIRVEFEQPVKINDIIAHTSATDVKVVSDTQFLVQAESDHIRNELFQLAVKNNLTILTIQKEHQKLEDVFKELTK